MARRARAGGSPCRFADVAGPGDAARLQDQPVTDRMLQGVLPGSEARPRSPSLHATGAAGVGLELDVLVGN